MIYAITGGIGAGKSFYCKQLETKGYPIFYCDDEAKKIIRTHPDVRQQLISLVGDEVYNAEGTLQKKVLAAYIGTRDICPCLVPVSGAIIETERLRVHEPFETLEKVIKQNSDIKNKVDVFETMKKRMLVEDTDEGRQIKTTIGDLKLLIQAYQLGLIKENKD